MKIQFIAKDAPVINSFLAGWIIKDSPMLPLLFTDECETIFLDCDIPELQNCFIELTREGFTQSAKKIFQGDHFYRSDTGKCPRCWRHRPEIHWNNSNIPDCEAEVCDRCSKAIRED